MDIIVDKTIQIHNEQELISNVISEALTVPNPKFEEAVAAGRSTWGLTPVIKNFTFADDGVLHLPRGYIDEFK
jgi:hypothetical protein